MLDCLPATPWHIPASEIERRRDLRSTRIFTIDPPTAKDLDDALHCTALADGSFEVGVHIADVSHFIAEGSALDMEARARATSTYLVDRVIPMLPALLCEELCSLNPAVDRLTFSVVWRLDANGFVLDEWCGRTMICSATKMAYGTAQAIIDAHGDVTAVDASHTWPRLVDGVTREDVATDVMNLHQVRPSLVTITHPSVTHKYINY